MREQGGGRQEQTIQNETEQGERRGRDAELWRLQLPPADDEKLPFAGDDHLPDVHADDAAAQTDAGARQHARQGGGQHDPEQQARPAQSHGGRTPQHRRTDLRGRRPRWPR
ncbi:hypothetical protein HNR30_001478 [Nonomuraea soli]|uniref:Uncharacterized protein n=1 Tax=Nonomuraea soli TaxID=1032476 RepID=A0A7W0CFC1_9ACTN|nr:hypothetical protein [Nonomuraea soli]MBA2890143.1 hypothetical protein [Nonomuraea soli]